MKELSPRDHSLSIALSASAGSGKTYALTTRLISQFLTGVRPQEILAITFTNAAALDIRSKLFDRLNLLENGEARECSLFAEITGESPALLQTKARALRLALVGQYSLLRISTVHSFFLSVLRSFPRETGFLRDIAVLDEWASARLLDAAFERYYEFLSGHEHLFERMVRFLGVSRKRVAGVSDALKEAYGRFRARSYELRAFLEPAAPPRDAWDEFERLGESIRAGAFDGALEALVDGATRYGEGVRARGRGSGRETEPFIEKLKKFLERRRVGDLADIPALKRDLGYLGKILDFLPREESERFAESLETVRSGVARFLEAQMRAYVNVYVDIYEGVSSLYGEEKAAANAVDYADIELFARDLLARMSDFDYFDYSTGARIRHVLIDEFQDTSRLQWDALEPLVRHCLLGGGTLFYVGDVKQSIYRWRGGEPGLFDRVAAEFPVEKRALHSSYRQNGVLLGFVNDLFESIERTREPGYGYTRQRLPAERTGAAGGYVSVRQYSARQDLLEGIAGCVLELGAAGVAPEACAVLCRTNREIGEVEKALSEGGVEFTSPGRSRLLSVPSVLDALDALRVALRPDERLHTAAILRSPAFRSTYGEVESLLGPVTDPDGYLTRAGNGGPAGGGPLDLIRSLSAEISLLTPSEALKAVYERLGLLGPPAFRGDSAPQGGTSSHDGALAPMDALFELLEAAAAFERMAKGAGLSEFLAYVSERSDELTVKQGGGRGVRLLTIHSSKGLEFHTVIVPFLDRPFRFDPDGSLLLAENGKDATARFCLARAVYRDHLSRDEGYARLFGEAERRERIDELNALYVALTRARENLLVLPLVKGNTLTLGKVLVEALDPGWGTAGECAGGEGRAAPAASGRSIGGSETAAPAACGGTATATPDERMRSIGSPVPGSNGEATGAGSGTPAPRELCAGALETLAARGRVSKAGEGWGDRGLEARGALPRGTLERRVELLKGLVVHKALELTGEADLVSLGRDGGSLEGLLVKAMALVGAGASRREREKALLRARLSLANAVTDERIARYFSSEALREAVSLSHRFGGGIGRIDRVLIGETVEVLDFKTHEVRGKGHLEELVELYRAQVTSYCASLASLYPGRAVNGGLYFTDAPYRDRIVEVFKGDSGSTDL